MRRWAAGQACSGAYDGDLFNETSQPLLEMIPPRRAAAAAVQAAEEVDALLLEVPDEVVEAALARPDAPNLDRGSHRQYHLDQVERARCDSIGARRMAGVRLNLAAAIEARAREEGFDQVAERDESLLAEVIGLLARESFTGDAPPPGTRRMVDAFRPWFDAQVTRDLASLAKLLDDQDAFANMVRQLVKTRDLFDLWYLSARLNVASPPKDLVKDKRADYGYPVRSADLAAAVHAISAEELLASLEGVLPARERPGLNAPEVLETAARILGDHRDVV